MGGSASSLRWLVGALLEHETFERAIRVLTGDSVATVSKRFELDPRRVRLLPAGALLLEKISERLDCPLRIGRGGLRDGVILDLLSGSNATRAVPPAVTATLGRWRRRAGFRG